MPLSNSNRKITLELCFVQKRGINTTLYQIPSGARHANNAAITSRPKDQPSRKFELNCELWLWFNDQHYVTIR